MRNSAQRQARFGLCGRTDHLYLTSLVEQFRQILGSQRLVFDNNSSDPDSHENKS
jgi:hypothetical protein